MNQAVLKIGFLCLPDDKLEIFSAMTRLPGYHPEVVFDFDENAYSYRMAEILQIPTATDLSILQRFPCNVIVIPDDRADLRQEVVSLIGEEPAAIRTVSEMARELGLPVDVEDVDYEPTGFTVPVGVVPSKPSAVPPDPGNELKSSGRLALDSETGRLNLNDRLVIDRMKTWNAEQNADTTGTVTNAVDAAPPDSRASGETVGENPVTRTAEGPGRPKAAETSSGQAVRRDAPQAEATARAGRETASESALNENLSAVAETLSLAFDKHLLLKRILDIAVASAGGDAGSIMLLDESGEYLKIAVAIGLSEDVTRSTRQRIGEGVAGNVLMEGRGRIVTDRLNDPRYRSGRDRTMIAAAVCAPIRVGTRAIGILNVSSNERKDVFNANTLALLDKFGVQVAGVILKALELPTNHEESIEAAFASQVEAIMSLPESLPRRLGAVADRLAALAGASAGRICIYDATGKRLEVFGGNSPIESPGRSKFVAADDGIRGWVLRVREPETLVSTRSDRDRRAIFYVPLMASEPYGLIELESVPVDEIRRVEILNALIVAAASLAARIERDRLARFESRRTEQMMRLSDFAAEMMCLDNMDDVVSLALRAAEELFGADLVTFHNPTDASVAMNNPEFGELGDQASLAVLDFNGELCAEARTTGGLVAPTSMSHALTQRLTALSQVRWSAAIPLASKRGDAGILSLFGMNEDSEVPVNGEWTVLEKLGGYLARALDRVPAQSADATGGFLRWTVFQDRVAEEFKRADRYGRTFALTSIELEGFRRVSAEKGHSWTDAARYALADFVRSEVREVDIVSWVQEGRIAILSPEVGPEEDAQSRRIEERWAELLPSLKLDGLAGTPIRVRDAHFPKDLGNWEDCVEWIRDPFAESGPDVRAAG